MNESFEESLVELTDLLKERIYCTGKILGYEMDENRKKISKKVNEITANKNYNLIVDDNLDSIMTADTPLTRLFDQSVRVSTDHRENRNSQQFESLSLWLVSLSFYKSVDEKMEDGEVNFTIGIFNKNSGFITDFFSMVDMRNKGKTQKKKKFLLSNNFRENPDLLLVRY